MVERLIYFLIQALNLISLAFLLIFIIKLFYGLFLLIISIVYKNPKSKAISYIIKSFISFIIVLILWAVLGILPKLLWIQVPSFTPLLILDK